MIHYTVITKDITIITGNNKLEAVLVYAYIKSREKYNTHSLVNLTYQEISDNLNISLSTVKRIVPTFFDNHFLFTFVEHNYFDDKTHIKFHFHHSYNNFFYIDNSFLQEEKYMEINQEYRNQVRGLLLLIKAICLNGTNRYYFQRNSKSGINYAELSRLLNIDRDTLEHWCPVKIGTS